MDAPGLPDGPPMTSRGPKPKFFVCDDDDSDEEYEEEQLDWASRGSFRFPSVTPCGGVIDHHDSDIDIDDDGQDRNMDDGAPLKQYQAFPHISQFSPANGIRRQSLLSDMLLAEKLMATQGAASRRASTMLSSNGTPRCPSSGNSDGEMSHSGVPAGRHLYRSPRSTVQPPPQTLAGLAHQSIQSNQRQGDRSFTHSRNKESGLRRTKKSMFKNLDELVEKTEQTSCSSLPPISTCQFAMSPSCRAVSEAAFTGSTSPSEIASAPSSPSSPSPLKSSSKKHNLPTLPSTINTCCRTPATATTTTAFATATSKCTTSASSASAATAAAAAAGSSNGGMTSGWTRIPPVQAQVHSLYGQLTSAIQRAIS
ncbi:hypothetical protein BGX34_003810 [Mortierella sp. NVP85]|nr:hypothetical protein BGX34_003810 [Mortierella sp. NVP85]